MYKKVLFILLGALFLGAPLQAQDLKIAVVDLQKVLEQSKPGKRALSQFRNQTEDMRTEINQKKETVQKLKQELQQQSLMLSKEAKQKKQSKLQNKIRDYRVTVQRYQPRIKKIEQKYRDPVIEDILDIAETHSKQNDFSLVLDKQNSGIVFNKDRMEITSTIIEKVNQRFEEKQEQDQSN